MKVCALIPARGGSKGIPRKNIAELHGKPLLAYPIETALAAKKIERVFVSTDSEEIAAVARKWGAEVPFIRPAELAEDLTEDLPVFLHFLDWLESEGLALPEQIVHLRATSPLRDPAVVDAAVEMLASHDEADSLRSISKPIQSPFKMWHVDNQGFLDPLIKLENIPESYNKPRQCLPEVFWQNGYVDITRGRTLRQLNSLTGRRLLGFPVQGENVLDIDTVQSLEFAEWKLSRGDADD